MPYEESQKDEYHLVFGGRLRRDLRFWDVEPAPTIRKRLVIYNQITGMDLRDIAKSFGISVTVLSMAAGGRAGKKMTEDIVEKLRAALEPDVQI
jgi:hypothetical protein